MPDWNYDGFDDITGCWVGVGGSLHKRLSRQRTPDQAPDLTPESTDPTEAPETTAEPVPPRPRRIRRI